MRGTNVAEVIEAVNEAAIRQEEGIVIKSLKSPWVPGERGAKWLKLKPEYSDHMSEDLDLLIVGGYYGTGPRAGLFSHFMLGVYEPPIEGEHPTVFRSFCKVRLCVFCPPPWLRLFFLNLFCCC